MRHGYVQLEVPLVPLLALFAFSLGVYIVHLSSFRLRFQPVLLGMLIGGLVEGSDSLLHQCLGAFFL